MWTGRAHLFGATEARTAELLESPNARIESLASEDGPEEGGEYVSLVALYPLDDE